MFRLYEKNQLNFALVWIGVYVVLLSVADNLSAALGVAKIISAPVGIALVLVLLAFLQKHGLMQACGLCRFRGSLRGFSIFCLWF